MYLSLIYLSVIISRSIHVAANDIISSFLWLSILFCVCVCVCVSYLLYPFPLSMDISWLL